MAMAELEQPGEAWKVRGACLEVDPAVFFPGRGESTDEAKAICSFCPVLMTCREFGMTQKHGIWGGLSERQRRAERRRRGITLPVATPSPVVADLDEFR